MTFGLALFDLDEVLPDLRPERQAVSGDNAPILIVMPARAGIPLLVQHALTQSWIPAFAGMTALRWGVWGGGRSVEIKATILTVMPAKAGIPLLVPHMRTESWIPAFVGMTA